jgi:hypothetical protein
MSIDAHESGTGHQAQMADEGVAHDLTCAYAPRPPRGSRARILPRGREWFLVAIMALAIAVIVVGVWLSLRCGVTTSGGK